MPSKKAQKKIPRGYYIRVITNEGEHVVGGLSSVAEAIYRTKRYYNRVPNVISTHVMIGQREVYRYFKGEETMSNDPFETFSEDLKAQGKSVDTIPNLDEEMRAIFARVGVPFFIRGVREATTKYGPSLTYDIDVDVTSNEYQGSFKNLQIGSRYVLWFPQTPGRIDQWKLILEGKGIIEHQRPLILAKVKKDNGREMYDFRLYSSTTSTWTVAE